LPPDEEEVPPRELPDESPPRVVAVPVLEPLRVRPPWSLARDGAPFARIGASTPPHALGVGDEPIELPPEVPDTLPPPPADDEPDEPLDVAEPVLSPPPRGAAEPVVLPLEVRSCPAHAGSPATLTMPAARARVPTKL
jgi:hypothetical protein